MGLFKKKLAKKPKNGRKITTFENLLKDSTKNLKLLQSILRNNSMIKL